MMKTRLLTLAITLTLVSCCLSLVSTVSYAADKGAVPVAHWRFDEGGGGTAYDETANNNDGTLAAGTLGTNTAVGQIKLLWEPGSHSSNY